MAAVIAHQRGALAADFDGVRLLAGTDLTAGVFGGQVVELVDGGFVVGDECGLGSISAAPAVIRSGRTFVASAPSANSENGITQ